MALPAAPPTDCGSLGLSPALRRSATTGRDECAEQRFPVKTGKFLWVPLDADAKRFAFAFDGFD
jgi:hypothetical protein